MMKTCTCGGVREWSCPEHGDPTTISRAYLLDLETSVQRLQDELAQARQQIAHYEDGITWETTCLNCAETMTRTTTTHLQALAERDSALAVVAAAREFWQWHLRGQPGTPDTLYPMTYAAQDAWQEERARLENVFFAALAAFDAAQEHTP